MDINITSTMANMTPQPQSLPATVKTVGGSDFKFNKHASYIMVILMDMIGVFSAILTLTFTTIIVWMRSITTKMALTKYLEIVMNCH